MSDSQVLSPHEPIFTTFICYSGVALSVSNVLRIDLRNLSVASSWMFVDKLCLKLQTQRKPAPASVLNSSSELR